MVLIKKFLSDIKRTNNKLTHTHTHIKFSLSSLVECLSCTFFFFLMSLDFFGKLFFQMYQNEQNELLDLYSVLHINRSSE